ncbi:MAG: SpoVA/SpoVAEb family sporulation membrane protein [Clostridia bacterium]|nr:SpoVA/SpoVAEb family sporulation membrane protein [Clostridia bacterium]
MEKTEYQKYVNETVPRTQELKTLLTAFITGGIICMIGEGILDLYTYTLPMLGQEEIATLTTITLIFIGGFLTAVGLYDKLGRHCGAGTIIPITGFANSIVSPAIEFNREGVFQGVMSKMFDIAGPVIVSGVTLSAIVGIIFYLIEVFA